MFGKQEVGAAVRVRGKRQFVDRNREGVRWILTDYFKKQSATGLM